MERLQINISGAVQGVGFRPFVYRIARELGLTGWVLNSSQGVIIEVEGERARLNAFIKKLKNESPPNAVIQGFELSTLDPAGFTTFEIRHSDDSGPFTTLILPDIATCHACLIEIFDPKNRRYLYPFTTCTHCGPRYSIIESIPYDRANTTMNIFNMCRECQKEFEDPEDRRFHSQTNACPACGPAIFLWDNTGTILAKDQEAIERAANAVRDGWILALKGLGGFHLIVDGRNEEAVRRLRQRKNREEKPFALMYPSIDSVKSDCYVSDIEEHLLLSPESPIVLLRRKKETSIIAPSVAPCNPYLGVMLPYTPLHHILLKNLSFPVVATSGNTTDEPVCTDEHEALERLGKIGDLFLVHNRPIARYIDDSVTRVVMERIMVLRRARGFAPLPIRVKKNIPPIIAVGGHLKNTVAVTAGNNIFLSPHIGDLETIESLKAFEKVISDFQGLYSIKSPRVVSDAHPEYISTKIAKTMSPDTIRVQHHFAHIASCMADNDIDGSLLGVAWDGTGYGLDGTIWGGEFICADGGDFKRIATFRSFRLPGGVKAIREPARVALGLLYEIWRERVFEKSELHPVKAYNSSELRLLKDMLNREVNSPYTTSAGRLFDGVASIIGVRQKVSYEGQAAMELEYAINKKDHYEVYPFHITPGPDSIWVVDWAPMIIEIFKDLEAGVSPGLISTQFHNTLTEVIIRIAHLAGKERVVLTGGCFQNLYLTERTIKRLRAEGFTPYWHQRIPPNDGGISLGQIYMTILESLQN